MKRELIDFHKKEEEWFVWEEKLPHKNIQENEKRANKLWRKERKANSGK